MLHIKAVLHLFIISIVLFATSACKKEEPPAPQNNYLCVIEVNLTSLPPELGTTIFRDRVANKAACDQILADYRSGARTQPHIN